MKSTSPTRIAELCLSPDFGGLEIYALRVIRWLARKRIEYLAFVASGSRLESKLREEGLPYRPMRVLCRPLPLIAAYRLAKRIDAECIDVIHVHWGKDLAVAALACRLAARDVRIVYSRQMALTRPKHDWYHRTLYRNVNPLLVITRRLREEARRFLPLPEERIQLLYHGVAPSERPSAAACAEVRSRFGVPAGRFLVGLFGRIEPGKGQQVLVEALALLRRQGIEANAVLFGHPMQRRYLESLHEQIATVGLAENVRYGGFHPQPEAVMGCFDCIVLTTYNETFGLVLVEAMQAGVPVIGTAAGGVLEIIDDGVTGLLVPPGDATALAEAIGKLVRDNELWHRLAAAGKAAAGERFSEEEHFARLLACLRNGAAG